MGQISTIAVIILLWVLSFIEPSGWAVAYKLPEKVDIAITVIATLFFLCIPSKRLNISRQLIFWTLVSFVFIPLLTAGSSAGATYLVAFLIVYIVSQGNITPMVVRYSSLAIAILGIIVLQIYINGNLLSGWNDNAISMVGLFSFIYFSMFLILQKNKKQFWIWNIVTIIYLDLLFTTDCRSGMVFSIIAVIGIIFSSRIKKYITSTKSRLLILNAPLILALLVIAIATTPYFEALDKWSLATNNKGIFDGRDIIWGLSLEELNSTYFLGSGKFQINYHNSGVAAISVFGIIGYICWIKLFSTNLRQLQFYLSDKIVLGSFLAFTAIFLQQSLDLGLISATPNLLPYTILGVGLGRVRLLKSLKR